jgi:GTP 3',8-cyclase
MSIARRLMARVERLKRLIGGPPGPGAPAGIGRGVRITDGKIEPPHGCELDVVDHCNLACLDCNHGSPAMTRRFVDPDRVFRDFSNLAKVYRPKAVKVLGGEPLLHPNLIEVIGALRRSGICEHVQVVTNGLLLPRMPEEFWDVISELEISIYPESRIDDAALCHWQDLALEHGVRLRVFGFDHFRLTFAMRGFEDPALVTRVYRNCKLAHVWGCHSVRDGYLYRCPQSNCLPILLGWPTEEHTVDGIEIRDSPGFMADLYRFLGSQEPLQSCRHCLGSSGKMRSHGLVSRHQWTSHHDVTGDALVDDEKLRLSEAGIEVEENQKTPIEKYSVG